MIDKIISGGQTGVDLAALDSAIELNISHGGYCPRGRLYEIGFIPDKYNLTETEKSDYAERTILNLTQSDGTIIFSPVDLSKILDGTRLTVQELEKLKKPFLHIDEKTSFETVKSWVIKHNIRVLNIAGPRESSCVGIYESSKKYFRELFDFLIKLKIVNLQGKTMPYAEQIAEFAIKKFHEELPPELLSVAVSALIDQYGLQIGGSEFPWSRGIHAYVLSEGTCNASTITRYGEKVSPTAAAFINGCFAHAQDFDDSHQEAQTHPGSVVIPAAMALGESLDCDGKTVLKAIAIGMEIMLRLAHALCPACIEGGHHTPPTVGPFGAAIACGLLLGLNAKQLTNALGICGSYAGGLVAYTVGGGSVKRIHTGIAARNGLEAALLAKNGITGPENIIEGAKGLFEVFGRGRAFPERLFADLGERYLLTTLMFKPYNCCYLIHPAIELYLELVVKNRLAPEDIQSVKVGFSRFSVSHAGTITQPHDALGAQFSTAFTLALSHIVEAPGLHSYSDENLANPKVRNLAKKIEVFCDEEINAQFPRENGCVIEITSVHNKNYSGKITAPKGSPTNLMAREDVIRKYFLNVADVLTSEEADLLLENLVHFQTLGIRDFARSAQKSPCLIQAKL